MFPGGRHNYPYRTSLQDPNYGGGYYPDRMYSHTPGTRAGETRYNQVYGTSSGNWSYTDNGRYGRFEPYHRVGPQSMRRLRRG
ncbi:uncharacterized protein K460DRAFT_282230 [Cucurbitaria berberidis CBS 394.84]|uniref:Uncharacterized protein n=1 Tax=Cucurbitaria berberidis CBS 394.84 TaxID=1168544 RepID=A0A9P4GG60_9PLEO|nr:uncharacterized protein K460DRAFT_282230 [Cucurbitaria berberidis CBS 394.84]KAF1844629.1 hypothetical protein K460DRAFT_282230 [Cucurbitaria berberidis CBS 394.84]